MYMTRDYLKVDPWSAVIEMINNEYGVELNPSSTSLVSLESLGGTKTKLKLRVNWGKSPDDTQPKPELPEYFFYDRIDLATLFKGGPIYVMDNVRMPMSTFQIMGMLDKKNDVVFSYTDLVPDQFDRFDEPYKLVAGAQSLRFVGEIPFSFENTLRYDLSSIVLTTELPKANTWQFGNDGTKITGNYLFTAYDFTHYRDELIPAKSNHLFVDTNSLRGMIKHITKQDWILSGNPEDNNLCYSIYEGEKRVRVVYNGVIDPAFTSRTDMSYVMVLELSNTLCTNVSGFLLFHYN
ncbi:virion structural protein [Pseudomonas phage Phabio]|uniref:Virion structural protein n=1 Tax=Pseudomonas phage Phabio TaxID=2006668 RepID=A0A1Y0SU27_9CAUD|nr:virion structural protein [Pseudomonas phage Phabio]ARV76830.1 virion structural protein [Pseudomonas phage Phabio]